MSLKQVACHRAFDRSGFTLAELVVAAGITIALAAIMISIVANLMASVSRNSGSLLSNNQARIALDYLAQDLQSAVMRADNNVWLAATIQPDQSGTGDSEFVTGDWSAGTEKPGNANPGNANSSLNLDPKDQDGESTLRLEDYRFGMAGVWLRMFTVEPDSNNGPGNYSTPRAIAYQIERYEVGSGSSLRYGLFRSPVSPDNTFLEGFDLFFQQDGITPSDYNIANGTAGAPGNVRKPRSDYLLANNVIDLGVRFWSRGSGGAVELLFPADDSGLPSSDNRGFAATSDRTVVPPNPATGAPALEQMKFGFPEIAEVFLRVLTDDGARQIEALERGLLGARPSDYATYGEWWWAVAEANSRVYTRSVEMKVRAF